MVRIHSLFCLQTNLETKFKKKSLSNVYIIILICSYQYLKKEYDLFINISVN